MDPFTAIADTTRRTILEMLAAHGSLPAGNIYQHFKASPPAISQHLKVLREARLVRVERQAQKRIYYLNPEPMKKLEKWIKQFAAHKEAEFQRLDGILEKLKAEMSDAPLLPFTVDES